MKPENIFYGLVIGNDDPKFAEFMNNVITENTAQMHVLDACGHPLVKDAVYLFEGEKVQIIEEQYGQGNILDTYYHVYFRKSDFSTSRICIEGKYPNGVFGGAVYKSKFVPG
jgi:hypothetical protein